MNGTLPISLQDTYKLELPDISTTTSRNYWKNAKVQKATMGTLSTLTTIGSCVLFTAVVLGSLSPLALLGAVPLLAIGGTLAYKAYATKDYNSPQEVKGYRKQCLTMSLPEIIKEHGHKNLFHKQLLSQGAFRVKYKSEEAQLRGLPAIVDLYRKYESYIKGTGFVVPHPSESLVAFKNNCRYMTLDQISSLHSLDYLFDWRLLEPKEFETKYLEKQSTLNGLLEVQHLHAKVSVAKNKTDNGRIYNIPSPLELIPAYRAAGKQESLGEILAKHGYENLCRYELLSKEDFQAKYHEHVENLLLKNGLPAALNFYESMKSAALQSPAYRIPDPSSLSATWHRQVVNKSAIEIFTEFNLDQLLRLNILPQGPYRDLLTSLYKEKARAEDIHLKQAMGYEDDYRKTKNHALNDYNRGIKDTNLTLTSLIDAESRIRLDIHRVQNEGKSLPKSATYFTINNLLSDLNTNARAQERQKASKVTLEKTYHATVASAEKLKAQTRDLSSRERQGSYDLINQKHNLRKSVIFS